MQGQDSPELRSPGHTDELRQGGSNEPLVQTLEEQNWPRQCEQDLWPLGTIYLEPGQELERCWATAGPA